MDNRPIFDEHEADRQVISSLLREIKRRQGMSKIVKTTDGVFYRVEDDQVVSADEVQTKLSECQAEADALQALLAPAAPADQGQPAAPADANGAAADTTTPPAASSDPAAASNDANGAPADQATPAADPAAAPSDPNAAQAADPSAAQPEQTTQPDPSAVPPLQ